MSGPGVAGRVIAAAATVGGALVAYGTLVERRAYALRRFEVPILPAGADPIRVLHIADLHLAPWQHDRVRWVRSLAGLHPDLVINTGDNFGHAQALDAIHTALKPLLSRPGAFVYGSNDYFTPKPKNPFVYLFGGSKITRTKPDIDTAALTHILVEAGWRNLNNRDAILTVNDRTLALVGTGDAHLGQDDLDEASRNLTRVPADVDAVIGVTHAPYQRVLDTFTSLGADLILAGHTHGGQIQLPGIGALVSNCDLPTAYVNGLHRWKTGERTAWLHVSAGLGTSIYAPLRLGVRPEATLLTLVPRPELH